MENLAPVDVIICHHRGLRWLERCLSTLYNGSVTPARVVVVDNGSSDGSREMLAARFPQVHVLHNTLNVGFVRGNLQARAYLADSDAAYLWLLNHDTEVAPDALAKLLRALRDDPQTAAVQPKMRSIPYAGRFDYAGAAGGYLDVYGYPFARGRVFEALERDHGQYDTCVPIFWASGASFFVRTRVLDEVGFLDARYYAVSEEIDLSWRIWLAGYRILSVPDAVVYHHGGFRPGQMSADGMYLRHRNSLMTLLKNYSTRSLWRYLPLRLLLEAVALAYYLLIGRPAFAWALLRGLGWLLRHLPCIWRERRDVQQRVRRVPDSALRPVLYPVSVVWLYHMRNQSKYTDYQQQIAADSPPGVRVGALMASSQPTRPTPQGQAEDE